MSSTSCPVERTMCAFDAYCEVIAITHDQDEGHVIWYNTHQKSTRALVVGTRDDREHEDQEPARPRVV